MTVRESFMHLHKTTSVIREKHVLTEQQIKELLDPVKLTGLDKVQAQEELDGLAPGRTFSLLQSRSGHPPMASRAAPISE